MMCNARFGLLSLLMTLRVINVKSDNNLGHFQKMFQIGLAITKKIKKKNLTIY